MNPPVEPSDPPVRELIIDRFEGDLAVVEVVGAAHTLDLPRWLLPANAREGDVIRAVERSPGTVTILIDDAATALRLKRAAERVGELRKRDPGGDIVL